MSTGVGVGGFIFSLLVGSLLIPTCGWQGGYYGIAVAHVVIIPLAILMIGKKKHAAATQKDSSEDRGIKSNVLGEMLRSPSLWVISVIFFMFLFSLVGTVQIQKDATTLKA